jgi:hypothetical protein
LNHLKKCMIQCKNNGISFNLEKCAFCVNFRVLLGHIVYQDGLLVNAKKNYIITNMSIATNVTKLKNILRVVRFY